MRRLEKVTAQPGVTKTALAAAIGIGATQIWKYLNGKSQPSGEVALLMLKWVEDMEREIKKSPGGAETPPRPKTRSKKSSHEKPRSNPRKK